MMSQERIMNFLDQNKGKLYTANQIIQQTKVSNTSGVYRCLRKIMQRNEYEAVLISTNKPFGTKTFYRAKEDEKCQKIKKVKK